MGSNAGVAVVNDMAADPPVGCDIVSPAARPLPTVAATPSPISAIRAVRIAVERATQTGAPQPGVVVIGGVGIVLALVRPMLLVTGRGVEPAVGPTTTSRAVLDITPIAIIVINP